MKYEEEKVALYARVSTEEQNLENQIRLLKEWAAQNGVPNAQIYAEKESTRRTRPEKERIKALARRGKVKTIVFTRLDRWGRSMTELVQEIEEFSSRGVALISLKDGLEFGTPAGRLQAHILSAFASFERDLISARTREGLARARARGKKLGRPRKRRSGKNE